MKNCADLRARSITGRAKTLCLSATALSFAAMCHPAMASERPYGSFKLMTYNMHFNGYSDGANIDKLSRIYKAVDPDVIALQEIFPIPLLPANYNYTAELANMLKRQQIGDYRHITYAQPGGNLLAEYLLDPIRNLLVSGDRSVLARLPGSQGVVDPYLWNNPMPYTLLDAGNGLPQTLIGTAHISAADDPSKDWNLQDFGKTRLIHAKRFNQIALGMNTPMILAGDFNAGDISERGLHDRNGSEEAQSYPRGEYIDKDGTYAKKGEKVPSNLPITLNVLKKQYVLLQSESERERFGPAHGDDNNYTYPYNRSWDLKHIAGEFASSEHWDRQKVDHIFAARPFGKWWAINNQNGEVSGAIRNDLTTYTTMENGKAVSHDISDHTPVANRLQWVGPQIERSSYWSWGNKDWTKLVWSAQAQKNPVKTEDGGKTFYLTRNNDRKDMYLGQVSDENGKPNLSYLADLVERQNDPLVQPMDGWQWLWLSLGDKFRRGPLLQELNDRLALAKTPLNCQSNYSTDSRFTSADLANIKALCFDDHTIFDEVRIQDGLTVRVDEDAALGRSFTQSGKGMFDAALPVVTLNDGTLKISGSQMKLLDRDVRLEGVGGAINVDAWDNNVATSRPISGSGNFIKDGAGTLTLAANDRNSYTGRTIIRGGTLALSGNGDISASESVELYNPGTKLNIAATSYGPDHNGSLTIRNISGQKGTALELGNKPLILNNAHDTLYEGTISGSEISTLTKEGAAQLKLTGDSSQSYRGKTYVNNGTLRVNGKLGGTVVVDDGWHYTVWPFGYWGGGKLDGTGEVGGINMISGKFSPGNSVGVMHVPGSVNFGANNEYQLEASPAGLDQLFVGGVASLDGALTLMPEIGSKVENSTDVLNLLGQRLVIISAEGGIHGHFASQKSDYLFIDNRLDYGANEVGTTLYRNDKSFADLGRTINERSTAGALEALGRGNKLHDMITISTDAAAVTQFYAASAADIHASIAGTLATDQRFVSEAATDRVRGALGGLAINPVPVLETNATGPIGSSSDQKSNAFWTKIYGASSSIDSDGNATARDRNIGGFVAGVDGLLPSGPFGEDWRFGLLAGYGQTVLDGSGSNASVDSLQLGAYGGTKVQNFDLTYGVNLGHHSIETSRFANFADMASSFDGDYNATSVQFFGEAAYDINTSFARLEPFAGVNYTHLKTQDFSETGDIAALSGLATSTDLTTTTLGLRASRDFRLADTVQLTTRGMLGWKHVLGDVVPEANLAFAGGKSFPIKGLAMARDELALEAGFDIGFGKRTSVGVSYSGLVSERGVDNAIKADLSVRF